VRVVFDTNIFVSAFATSGLQSQRAIDRVTVGDDRLLISKQIIDEVLNVLKRKLEHDSEGVARTALLIADMGEILATKQRLKLLRDDPDNRILECAVAGRADLIVTGDRELLDLKQFEGIRIGVAEVLSRYEINTGCPRERVLLCCVCDAEVISRFSARSRRFAPALG
jgi:putative PIN family toxin of toxin-antitoxin system